MWQHTAERSRSQMTIWRMRFTCWIHKATNTHSEYVIFTAFPQPRVVRRTRLNLTLYLHCLPCSHLVQRPYASENGFPTSTVVLHARAKVGRGGGVGRPERRSYGGGKKQTFYYKILNFK
jgi:hypothetical protein